MRHMVLFDTQYRVLLVASLISACLLMGCASNFHFERSYKPAATLEGASAVTLQPRATPPQLVYSQDPDRDGRLLRQYGYVLIGTTSFYGAADLPYAEHAAAQGQKVGAGIDADEIPLLPRERPNSWKSRRTRSYLFRFVLGEG